MTPREQVIKYSYANVPTIKKFSESSAFIRGLMGPFGSGKSSGCVIEILKRSMAQKVAQDGYAHTRWLVVRNTYRQLADTTIRTFFQWCPPHLFGDYKQSTNSFMIHGFEGVKAEVLFRALDRPDHVSNLLSLEITGCWANEAREIPWAIIEAIQGRVGRFPAVRDGGCTWSGVIADTNPAEVDSKWFKFFENPDLNPEHAAIFKQPSGLSKQAENLGNLPANYYQRLAEGKDPEWVKVYVDGEYGFSIDGRIVFPEYKDHVHCTDKIKSLAYTEMYRGWDFGLTPSCIFMQVSPHGQLLVLDELVSEEMGVDRFSDDVLEHSSRNYSNIETFIDIGDPAGEQRAQTDEKTCFSILRSKGIQIEPGLQTEAIRLESVRKPLTSLRAGLPGFQLHPRCRTLRKAFMGGYVYRRLQTSQERYTDKPDKNAYSHPMDALQYPCTRIFGGGLTTPKSMEDLNYREPSFLEQYERSEITGY